MKNILITGGAGFIGSHVVRQLLSLDYHVYCIDNFDNFYDRKQKMLNISDSASHEHFHLIEKDILDRDAFSDIKNCTIDLIIHLAAKAGIRQSIENPAIYQKVNILGTLNILEFAREQGIKKIIHASSSSVYGINKDIPWKETITDLKPISPYASSKIAGEDLCYVYNNLYGLRCTILRFFTVYGPGQRPDLAIHKFANLITAGKEINLFGNGETQRDYTFIDDIVAGIIAAIHYHKTSYDIFNLGNSYAVSLNELISTMEDIFELKIKRKYLPAQAGDVPVTYADIHKAKTLLNYNPVFSLRDGLEKFKQWHMDYYNIKNYK